MKTFSLFAVMIFSAAISASAQSVSPDPASIWKTRLYFTKDQPVQNPSVVENLKTSAVSSLGQIQNCGLVRAGEISGEMDSLLSEAKTDRCFRLLVVSVIEKQKSQKVPVSNTSYMMKRIPWIYDVTVRLYCADTGTTDEHTETFTEGEEGGHSFAACAEAFNRYFASPPPAPPAPPAPRLETRNRSAQFSFGLPMIAPAGAFRDYANVGYGIRCEAQVEALFMQGLFFGASFDGIRLAAKHAKIAPYMIAPMTLSAEYRYAVSQGWSVSGSFGGGAVIHSIHGASFTDPLWSAGAKVIYRWTSDLSFFASANYSQFYDSRMTGSWAGLLFGCSYNLDFRYDPNDHSFSRL